MTQKDTPSNISNSENTLPKTDPSIQPVNSKRLGIKEIIETLNNFKEMLLLAAFLGGIVGGAMNYFVRRDDFDALDCFTKLTVRQLQADASIKNLDQLLSRSQTELKDKQQLYDELKNENGNKWKDRLSKIKDEIDNYKKQEEQFSKIIDYEKTASQTMLSFLDSKTTGKNACQSNEKRKEALDKLALLSKHEELHHLIIGR